MLDGQFWHCTREEYDASERLRSSQLKDFRTSRKTFHWRHVLGKMPPRTQSKEMLFGTCFHGLILEGEIMWSLAGQCEAKYASGERKGQQCVNHGVGVLDDVWLCGQHSKGKELSTPANLLTKDDEATITAMETELRESPCAELLTDKYAENAITWTDAVTGIECKALPDILRHDGKIVDLKTVGDFNAEQLWRQIEDLGWGFSIAFYELGIRHMEGMNHPLPWSLLLCEKKPPYRVQEFSIPSDYQEICRGRVRAELIALAECRRTGAYEEEPLNVGMPQWVLFRDEKRGIEE